MMEDLGYMIPLGFQYCSIDNVVTVCNSTDDVQEYLADPSRVPDANRKGHLNSDVGGTAGKRIMKKESGQG